MSDAYIGDTPEQLACGLLINGELWTGERISGLQQRNTELELLLQTAEQNAAEQRDMKAKAREQRDEQIKKNNELEAQVEQYKNYVIALTHADETGYIDDVGFVENFEEIRQQVEGLVVDHDREVAARAVENMGKSCFDNGSILGVNLLAVCVEYANKIKSGEVELWITR